MQCIYIIYTFCEECVMLTKKLSLIVYTYNTYVWFDIFFSHHIINP